MTLEKILEMLGVDKIDESKQTEVKDALETIIEAKAGELVEAKVEASLNEEKEKLVEEFEQKFEDYKEDVTSKFSNFVDSILEEEMVIPEKIVKYARLGELYEDLIDQFKVRLAIDEGLLDTEVKSMLGEAKEEIENLRGEVNELTGTKLQLEKDAKDLATHVYLRKKCDGLTEGQKTSVMNILEGASKEDIDKKFEIVVESIGGEATESTEEVNEETEETTETETVNEETTESTTEVSEEVRETMNEGNTIRDQWKRMLRENKF
jgi:hypothetical protein